MKLWCNGLAGGLSLLASASVLAEIVLLDGGRVVPDEPAYVHARPALRSVAFASSQARPMVILPSAPYFLAPPPQLLRVALPFALYLPAQEVSGFNASDRPSNRDATLYAIGRGHMFSQRLYYPETNANSGFVSAAPVIYATPYGVMPYYPPASGSGGFNQPIRPNNRDNSSYNFERAHRFSMDAYKSP